MSGVRIVAEQTCPGCDECPDWDEHALYREIVVPGVLGRLVAWWIRNA